MYKMLSVCLTLSFIFGETNLINQTNLKTNEVQKPKLEGESLIQTSHEVYVAKEKQALKRVKKQKNINLTKEKKEALYNALLDKEREFVIAKENDGTNYIEVKDIAADENDETTLVEKLEKKGETQNFKKLNYIQGPKVLKKYNHSSSRNRDHESLFFSEYAEGSSNHKYLEIYNPTNEEIDLSGYAYPNANNGGQDDGSYDFWNSFDDGAVIAPGDVYIIAHGSSDQSILDLADETHNYLSNGDDGYCLVSGGTWSDNDNDGNIDALEMTGYEVIDCVGDFGADPGSGWPVAGESNATKDHTLVRKSSVVSGNGGDWVTSAGTSADDSEWIVYDQNTWTYLGSHEMDAEEEVPYLSEGFEDTFPSNGWGTSGDGPWAQGSGLSLIHI